MSILQNFNYNGQLIQRRNDGFVNLTQMCQANGKNIADFLRLKSTKAYLVEMESDMGIPTSQLLLSKKGNSAEFTQGTWGHPEIAILLAQWISPKFHRWCNAHIFVLMASGQTSLDIDPLAEMKLKIELAKLERDKAALENRTIELRYTITQTCPEPVQQKILGYQEVTKIEYRDRVLHNDDLIRDGSTMTKAELCYRYRLLTRNGKPDYARLNRILNHADLPTEAFTLTASVLENREFNRDYLPMLDRLMVDGDRQLYLGE